MIAGTEPEGALLIEALHLPRWMYVFRNACSVPFRGCGSIQYL